MNFRIVSPEADRLGECPIWCDRSQLLYWVDVLTPGLRCYSPLTGEVRRLQFSGRRLGSIALLQSGGLLLACDDGLYSYDPETGRQSFLIDPEPGAIGHRKNDGRADPAGNFWIGTLREDDYDRVGKLYRVSPQLTVAVVAEKMAIPNGLAFDAIGKCMYFADTRAYKIWKCDFDPTSGAITNQRDFARTQAPSRPDGSCVDADGCLWSAEYAGGRLIRYSPNGEIIATIKLPMEYPTCCCFGGENLDVMFVTSAVEPLSTAERLKQNEAGHLLAFKIGIRGRLENRVGF